MYDLSVFTPDEATTVPAGTSLLVTGTSNAGMEPYLFGTLADGLEAGEGAVLVSPTEPARDAYRALDSDTDIDSNRLCLIDCHADAERERRVLDSGAFAYSVRGPDDLTGFGIGLAACFEYLSEVGVERSRVGFRSLRPILDATSTEQLFKFAHVVSSRLGSAGFLGLFALRDGELPPASRQLLQEAFDGTVEIQRHDEGTEAHLTGNCGESAAGNPNVRSR